MAPSPVVTLNRAVALSHVRGPAAALADAEAVVAQLPRWHLAHAVRADLLVRLGRDEDALSALALAIDLAPTAAEQRLLRERHAAVEEDVTAGR
jgi:RNA polymerase sigma-70 factor (ECF subfamily)